MNLKTGQLIKAKVNSLPFIDHYGIVVLIDGIPHVLHNTPFRSSVIDTYEEWVKTRKVLEVSDTKLTGKPVDQIIKKFESQCQRDYNLITYNCEHFIDCMLDNEHKSEQLVSYGITTALLIGFILLVK